MSSLFDDMLAKNKKRFDELSGRGAQPSGAVPELRGFASRPAGGPLPGPARTIQLGKDAGVVRLLNQRFGSDWRYEILEQQRDGNEAIVLCKLVLGKQGAVRTQFGRATIGRGSSVAGATGGLRFKLDSSSTEPGEDAAFRRAAEEALNNCVDLI